VKTIALILGLAFTALAADTWEKMKDCAARADKIVADELRYRHIDSYNASSHYSPKYNRCYVRFQIGSYAKDFRVAYTRLIDAYEGDDLATITEYFPKDKQPWAICTIGDDGGSDICPAARKFMDDHMHN